MNGLRERRGKVIMKEEAIKKINKIGKISGIFALISKILVGMGLFLLLVGVVVCFMVPESFVKFGIGTEMDITVDMNSIEQNLSDADVEMLKKDMVVNVEAPAEVTIDNNVIRVSEADENLTLTLRDIAWLLVVVTLGLVMTMITLCFISGLCKAFRDCSTPFEPNVIKKMQNFAYSLIPWALVSTVTQSVSNSLVSNKLDLTLSVDLGVIIVVLVVFLLVHIFKYGAVLQQESDETL